ncbi:MAG: nucleotidyltransferase family protein [Candidatus Korarchaeota archaeon]|nr:nucleotidyltransferase family protein [Candidatus Korarchaeota archaeon]NIU83540.1 nucleotidyltransferase [Candidatus Thorarchaeota archaeon]NIW13801.1 nucleotidyltransferase [Candidatus Thorarchaeota archaeon]NIW51929.1 nucleotidyltransferase [Candidatus Korarchaeota archaeon]
MKTLEEIKQALASQKERLREEYQVEELRIFGSYVRKEADGGRDTDILVEFSKPISLFTFLELEDHLSNVLDVPVDLVPKHGLKPGIRNRVLAEAVTV